MLSDLETIPRHGVLKKRILGDPPRDWQFIWALHQLEESAGSYPMLSLTVSDIQSATDNALTDEQCEEVLWKLQHKWEIAWNDAVYDWAVQMFPKAFDGSP